MNVIPRDWASMTISIDPYRDGRVEGEDQRILPCPFLGGWGDDRSLLLLSVRGGEGRALPATHGETGRLCISNPPLLGRWRQLGLAVIMTSGHTHLPVLALAIASTGCWPHVSSTGCCQCWLFSTVLRSSLTFVHGLLIHSPTCTGEQVSLPSHGEGECLSPVHGCLCWL